MSPPRRRRVAGSGLRPLLALLGLLACSKEAPRTAPPQTPAPEAPAAPEPAPPKEESESVGPSELEKDRAAPEEPAKRQFAPPPPAAAPAKPAAKARPAPGGAVRSTAPDSDQAAGEVALPDAQALHQRLDQAVKLATPDCPSARERKQAICDLAQQICEMLDRDPDMVSVESYCDDAKQRCSEAEKRTAQRCK